MPKLHSYSNYHESESTEIEKRNEKKQKKRQLKGILFQRENLRKFEKLKFAKRRFKCYNEILHQTLHLQMLKLHS